MTMFTEGRLQSYERMMQDCGNRNRSYSGGSESRGKEFRQQGAKNGVKGGDRRGSVQS